MAEVFGIVSGAAGIASLFSTCVECFDYIQLGRQFGKDFQTASLKLSFLKLRLSRWGAAVRIYDDPQLGHRGARQEDVDLTRNTLHQILVLLADSERASKKFRQTAKSDEDLFVFSSRDTDTRIVALENNLRQQAARRQGGACLVKLFAWAIYDKEYLSRLLGDISQLLDNLEDIFPAPDVQTSLAEAEAREASAGPTDLQAFILKTLQELSQGIDKAMNTQATNIMAAQGIIVTSVVTHDNARVRNGNFYSSSWKGEKQLPKGNGSVSVKSIQALGNTRVMNGHTYGDTDNFWD